MRYASGRKRATAWTLDFIILVTVLLMVSQITWWLVPEAEIKRPIQAMQLYTEREMTSFMWTFAIFTILVVGYNLVFPITKMRATPGQWLARIQVVRADGSWLGLWSSLRKFLVTLIKCLCIFFLGPLIAIAGGNQALSLIALLTPIGLMLVAFFVSLQSPENAWCFERLGGYRFIDREVALQGARAQQDVDLGEAAEGE